MLVSICLFGIGLFALGYLTHDYIKFPKLETSQIELNQKEISLLADNCKNLSLEDTTECLIDYVKPFYNYTIREDTDKTLEDIKTNGGDCYDYSMLYSKLVEYLGFDTSTNRLETENKAHRYTTIWNKELNEYCVIDQLNYWCQELQ